MQPLGENTVNVPAFLGKLWKMVNDPSTDHLISWSQAGNSFIIQNQAQFWYDLLPLYYKHNNMSSFVRQLNMYGFHKISSVENGTMDTDKDEIQFYHPFFQKDQPELLKNIKRKVTGSKTSDNPGQNLIKHDDLAKVLTDVKQLRGRQTNVDSQLTAMKQENTVLWRELALLRQKHMKQQQIVNKLIQFLVSLVQPTASARMSVGVKRRMPLMLHENPNKKNKIRKQKHINQEAGPTISELDNEIDCVEQLLDEEVDEQPMVNSPLTPTTSKSVNSPQSSFSLLDEASQDSNNLWDKPEYIVNEEALAPTVEDILSDNEIVEENLINNLQNETSQNNEKIFLNPTSRDTLLTNLINGSYNTNVMNGKNQTGNIMKKNDNIESNNKDGNVVNNGVTDKIQSNNDMTVATRVTKINNGTLCTNDCSREDLDLHLESTQSELDQLKDALNGCSSLDANALLGLFNDDAPGYGLTYNQEKDVLLNDTGVSGSELATCESIDFNELFDDSIDGTTTTNDSPILDSVLNTPLIIKSEPVYPTK